jgi:Cu2+-exporting ATPase
MLRVIRENLLWAAAYNLVAVPAAASGQLQPWIAAVGMSASSLLVVANALRLLPGRRARPGPVALSFTEALGA